MLRSRLRLPHLRFFGYIVLAVLLVRARLSASNAYWNDNPAFAFSTEQIGSYDSNAYGLGCPDGKLLVYGSYGVVNGIPVGTKPVRINTDGTLDQSFQAPADARPFAVQADGRWYVRDYPNSPSTTNRIRRLNVDGSVDSTFASVTLDYDVYGMLVLGNGQIVLYGNFSSVNGVTQRSLVRLNNDGTRDTSFQSPFATTSYYINSVAGDSAGKLYVTGYNFSFGTGRDRFVRLNVDGSIDTGWVVGVTFSGSARALVANGDGSVLVTLGSGYSYVRLTATGALDSVFSNTVSGSITGISSSMLTATSAGVVYYSSIDDTNTRRVRRLLPDGTPDNSFAPIAASSIIPAGSGLYYPATDTPHLQARQPLLHALADGTPDSVFSPPRFSRPGMVSCFTIQPDGKILVAGSWSYANGVATSANTSLIRIHANGSTDSGFAAALPAGSSVSNLLVQPDGRVLVSGSFTSGGITRTLIRLTESGASDASYPSITTGFGAVLTDSSGRIFLGTSDTANLVRLHADGTLDSGFNTSGLAQVTAFAPRSSGGAWVITDGQLRLLDHTGTPSPAFPAQTLSNYNSIASLPDDSLVVIDPYTPSTRVRHLGATGESLLTYQTNSQNFDPLTLAGVLFDLVRATNGVTPRQFLLFGYSSSTQVGCDPSGRLFLGGYGYSLAAYDRSPAPGRSFDAAPGFFTLPDFNQGVRLSLLPINYSTGFSFAAYGLHPLTVAWTKDGSPVSEDSTSYLHEITGASSAGTIRATVSSAYGSAQSREFVVTVDSSHTLAKIRQGPASRSVIAGTPVTLSINVEGAPVPTISWYRNGTLIPSASGSTTLNLGSVQPNQAGTYAVYANNRFYNDNGVLFMGSDSATAELTVFATAFDQWAAARFSSTELQNSSVSGQSADPDADGLSNLAEYALGLDPHAPSPGGGLTVTNNGTDWIVTYSRPADRTELTYRIERSTNLTDWTDTGVTPALVSSADGIETWRATYSLSSAPSCFFRLVITR